MPIGIQFNNLNRYRRYPFADDVDMRCTVRTNLDDNEHVVDFPPNFLNSCRVVHVGSEPVGSVYLVWAHYRRTARPSRRNWELGFEFVKQDGSLLQFFCKGLPFYPDNNMIKLPSISISGTSVHSNFFPTRVTAISDFDFANCISICTKLDLLAFVDTISDELGDLPSHIQASCRIKLAPSSVISLRSPHVMSVLDDVGEGIKDKSEIGMIAGYNTKFDVVPGTNALLVSAVAGTGAGEAYCESGVSTSFSGATVKKINGVSASPTGGVQLVGGAGIAVQPISGTNIINIYSTSENKDSMECKMS